MKTVVLVAAGGALGSVCRYAVQQWLNTTFPTGTLAVNITGCFLMGLGIGWMTDLRSAAALFLLTGFCGGFTTFSAFGADALRLFQAKEPGPFLLYTLTSVATGLLATYIGYRITHHT